MLRLSSQLAVLLACSNANSAAPMGLEDCVRIAIESREKIKDYHIVAAIEINEGANGKLENYRYEFEVWKKGTKYRLDRKLIEETENSKNNGTRWIYCRNCEREGMKLATSMGPNSITPVMFWQ
jgi:hypothetical protein